MSEQTVASIAAIVANNTSQPSASAQALAEFRELYPFSFPNGQPRCGFHIGAGWIKQIVRPLIRKITLYCYSHGIAPPVVLQVKEKFGTLRFYVDFPNRSRADVDDRDRLIHIEYVKGVISFAENMSARICEETGDKGELRQKDDGYWLRTLSPAWADANGFKTRPEFDPFNMPLSDDQFKEQSKNFGLEEWLIDKPKEEPKAAETQPAQ